MTDQFPPSEFDDWAATYDESASPGIGFPFDGYQRVLQTIFECASCPPGASVLDLGIGTGNLASLFSVAGCRMWGLDFSPEMLKHARTKLPHATLAVADLRTTWPLAFQRRFDCIVSAYTFHHFPLEEKVTLVQQVLTYYLEPGGQLLIGDIAFTGTAEEDAQRQALGEEWEQEYYWLAEETKPAFGAVGIQVDFMPISSCAGFLYLTAARVKQIHTQHRSIFNSVVL